jgi:hypothetical protein
MHLIITSLHPVLCRCDSIKKNIGYKNLFIIIIIIKSDLI